VGLWKKSEKKEPSDAESQEPPGRAKQFRNNGVAALKKQISKFKQHRQGPQPNDDEEEELKRMTSDPAALDTLSGEQLEHLRLRTESSLETYEREFTDEEKELLRTLNTPEAQFHLSKPIVGNLLQKMIPDAKPRQKQDRIDDLKLLLKLIVSKQESRIETPSEPPPATVPTEAQQREKLLAEIQVLRSEKAVAIEQLGGGRGSEDEIRRYENMYDNAIRRLETKLGTLLIK